MRSVVLLFSTITILSLTTAPADGATSFGFTTRTGIGLQKVTCATALVMNPKALYCASPGIARGAYDHRGVVELLPNGTRRIVHSGNDILLAVDGLFPGNGGRRPLL